MQQPAVRTTGTAERNSTATMAKGKRPLDEEQREKMRAELRRDIAERQKGYRERALALFPHLCASCGREFSGKRLRELTVHHKDHNHENNPRDGSNWELLCVYCHDHEHEKYRMAGHLGSKAWEPSPSIFTPLEGLGALFDDESPDPEQTEGG